VSARFTQFVGAELDLAQPKSKKAEARLGLGLGLANPI